MIFHINQLEKSNPYQKKFPFEVPRTKNSKMASFIYQPIRKYCASRPFFITTPIFYVNGAPHIGHLQSCVYADTFHRIERLLGKATIFSTGTDEHGLKIQQAAKAVDKDPVDYCSEVSKKFKDLFGLTSVSYTDFIRTTESRHHKAVQHFWNLLKKNDCLYKSFYEGWYNVSDEAFVPPSQVKEVSDANGKRVVCIESGNTLLKMQEENYLFKLSAFEKDLMYWLSKDVVTPKIFAEDLKRWIGNGLHDLSVSRTRDRLPWGIAVPDDPSQTIYVWLDALINYLTVSGFPNKDFTWPASCHIIGKDILRFHGIYWPAFLMAAGLEPPSSIFCHSHWTVDYEKMSKSKGNIVDPLDLIERYGSEGLRYFLLRAAIPSSDSNYTEVKIHRLLNAELADTLGNLLNRCCAPAVNPKQVFPQFSAESFQLIQEKSVIELIESVIALPEIIQKRFATGDFYHGLEIIMEHLRKTNSFVQSQKPWDLARISSAENSAKLDLVLHVAMEVLRVCGILLQPIIPNMSCTLLDKLGISERDRNWTNLRGFPFYTGFSEFEARTLSKENIVLYARRKA